MRNFFPQRDEPEVCEPDVGELSKSIAVEEHYAESIAEEALGPVE